MKTRNYIMALAIIAVLSSRVVSAQEDESTNADDSSYVANVSGGDNAAADSDSRGSASDEGDVSVKPNGGRAEAVMTYTGRFAGAVGGATAGFVVGAPLSPVGQAALSAAGGSAGDMAGEAMGRSAGQALDKNAEENQKSGRGGENDPRYNPATLWNN